MVREGKMNRNQCFRIRLSKDEREELNQEFAKSVCQTISEWARKKLLDKPIAIKYRNQTFDDFISEMILLRNELAAAGSKFSSPDQLDQFLVKVDSIKELINQFFDQWSQESMAGKTSGRC
jgi:hypothetical protein